MDDAIDKRYVGSDEVLIKAQDLAKSLKRSSNPHSRSGFFCPECREPVQFIYSEKITPYFKHLRDSPIAQECDRFSVQSSSSETTIRGTISKRFEGNQLLILQMGESFGFYLGLPPVSKEDISTSPNIKVSILNQDNNPLTAFYLLDKVRADETTYLQMKAITGVYTVTYSENPGIISSIWKEKTFGIQEDGALFAISSSYCKKIPINGNIYCGTEYFLICPEEKEPDKLDFLKVKNSWKLNVFAPGHKTWRVYKIVFTEVSQAGWDFALDLQTTLLDNEPGILPLWPPSILSKNKRTFPETAKQALFVMGVPLDECQCNCYDYKGAAHAIKKEKINSSQTLITTDISRTSLFLSTDEKKKKEDIELTTASVSLLNTCIAPEIKMKYGDDEIPTNISNIFWVKNKSLTFSSSAECTLEICRKDGSKTIYWNTMKQYILRTFFSIGDKLIIRHGNDIIRELSFIKKISPSHHTLMPEEYIGENIKKLDEFKTEIATPAIMRYILYRIKDHPNVSSYIRNCIITGKITRKTSEFLIETYLNGSE